MDVLLEWVTQVERDLHWEAVGDIFRLGADNCSCYSVSVVILFHLLVSLMHQVYITTFCIRHQLLPEFSFHQLPENFHNNNDDVQLCNFSKFFAIYNMCSSLSWTLEQLLSDINGKAVHLQNVSFSQTKNNSLVSWFVWKTNSKESTITKNWVIVSQASLSLPGCFFCSVIIYAHRQERQYPQFRDRKALMPGHEGRNMCHSAMASVGPAWAIMSWAARLPRCPTVCSKEETGEHGLRGEETEARETPPEWKRESGSKEGSEKGGGRRAEGRD